MPKILLTADHPANELELMKRIFYRNPDFPAKALEFYKMVKESGGILTRNWREIATKLNLTQFLYYKMVRQLIAVGLIKKEDGKYKPNNQFMIRLAFMTYIAQKLTGEVNPFIEIRVRRKKNEAH